jgi:hypothetical protein
MIKPELPVIKSEAQLEQSIQEKGLNAPRLTPDLIDNAIKKFEYHVFPGSCLTVCCLTLQNGFTVSGESACASPENFNKEKGEEISYKNAYQKIWMLEGYLLKQKLFDESQGDKAPTTAYDRLVIELDELKQKNRKLVTFVETEKFKTLTKIRKQLLIDQSRIQADLIEILTLRIEIF